MRALVIYWLIELLRWAPLAALITASLGLVALKRIENLPPWIARLTAPPFYLVSLPIATLVAGAEMLGLYSLIVAHFSSSGIFDGIVFQFFVTNIMLVSYFAEFFDYRLWPGVESTAYIGSFVGFWAATFVSAYLLWRTVWGEDHQPSSRIARPLQRGLFLLIAFAWADIYFANYILILFFSFGPSSVG
jgi:hypothetical protein